MKIKRLTALLLTALMLLSAHAFAAEPQDDWFRPVGDGYVLRRVACPEGEGMRWSEYRRLSVRYADNGQSVPLTGDYRSGWLYATVPEQDANRPLEAFLGEPVEFSDCYTSWAQEGGMARAYDPPLGTNELNIRGIILGDGAGNLKPDEVITRAEAFTLMVRLLGLEGGGDPGFADVTESDWFYETASAAKTAGITAQEDYFYPTRPVTRGEITVMLARAMGMLGWLAENPVQDTALMDEADIPDWAYDAYRDFDVHNVGIFTQLETGEMEEFGPGMAPWAMQEQPATRGEVITFIYDALRFLPVYPTDTAIAWGFDKEMPVIDGSTSTLPYTRALYSALFVNSDNHPDYPAAHSKSHASYRRLISGEADLLFIAAKPSRDILDEAAAAGVELEFIPIAYDAMVFFTNGDNPTDNITSGQIKEIYTDNAYDNWSQLGGEDAALIPYCRNADSGSQALMEEFFLEAGADIHPDIRRETTSLSMASVLTDVWDAGRTDPGAYALGYSIYYYYRSAIWLLLPSEDSLKLLSVDGVAPSDATIADGSYPLAGYNYIAIRADQPEDSLARRMVEFMLGPGQTCVVNAGYGPLYP